MDKYSVIIPVYNGELTISKLCFHIVDFFKQLENEFEIILVYDHGQDNSWHEILKLRDRIKENLTAVKLTRNFGQHNATICGIKYAKGDYIITMDEDFQHNPFDIQNLIKKQKENNYDLVYGKYKDHEHNCFKTFFSAIVKKILLFSIKDIHKDISSFRLIKKDIAQKTLKMNNSYTFLDGYLSRITSNVASTFVSYYKREAGKSSYNVKKLVSHTINLFVAYSNFPVKLVFTLSLFILILSSVFGIYLIFGNPVFSDLIQDYPVLMTLTGFGIGLILFALGIISRNIYRTNLKTTGKPIYLEEIVL